MICCCGSDTPMYALGGEDGLVTTFYAVADKIMMTAETSSAVTTANLSQARGAGGSVANPAVAGYCMGGSITNSTTTVVTADKLVFATDTTSAATSANLSQSRSQLYGMSERSSKGYVAGGFTTATPVVAVVTADQLTFSGDSTSAQTSANLSAVRKAAAGMTEGTSKGYWAGGYTGSIVTTTVVTADKITFSSDTTTAQTTANLSVSRAESFAGSDGSTKGYFAGGQKGSVNATVDKLTFSTDTTAAVTSTSFSQFFGASGSNGTKMLGVAGVNGATGLIFAGSNKMTFATDIAASAGVTISQASQGTMGFSYQAL